jgi:hypothetical protein
MTKRDIINKLQADQKALTLLLASKFASDLSIKLDAKLEYTLQLLEWIQQEGRA